MATGAGAPLLKPDLFGGLGENSEIKNPALSENQLLFGGKSRITCIKYRLLIRYVSDFGYPMTSAREFIADLAAQGRHHFAIADMRRTLSVSPAAAKLALLRLAKQ